MIKTILFPEEVVNLKEVLAMSKDERPSIEHLAEQYRMQPKTLKKIMASFEKKPSMKKKE